MNWTPVEGEPRRPRDKSVKSLFAGRGGDHRNMYYKDIAIKLEPNILPHVPEQYKHPFEDDKCLYCMSDKIGQRGDEFRPISQYGRVNKVNCVPCCGRCNSSKNDKCGTKLLNWIDVSDFIDPCRKQLIKGWYITNEWYMIASKDYYCETRNKTYEQIRSDLDAIIHKCYVDMSEY